jgi:hypothetical protein
MEYMKSSKAITGQLCGYSGCSSMIGMTAGLSQVICAGSSATMTASLGGGSVGRWNGFSPGVCHQCQAEMLCSHQMLANMARMFGNVECWSMLENCNNICGQSTFCFCFCFCIGNVCIKHYASYKFIWRKCNRGILVRLYTWFTRSILSVYCVYSSYEPSRYSSGFGVDERQSSRMSSSYGKRYRYGFCLSYCDCKTSDQRLLFRTHTCTITRDAKWNSELRAFGKGSHLGQYLTLQMQMQFLLLLKAKWDLL